jgi:hypothetical protein
VVARTGRLRHGHCQGIAAKGVGFYTTVFAFCRLIEPPTPTKALSPAFINGFHAKIEYDEELDLFRWEILGLNGGADFYGKNPKAEEPLSKI